MPASSVPFPAPIPSAAMVSGIYRHLSDGSVLAYCWFAAMHTRIDLALLADSEEAASRLADDIQGEVNRLESMLNRFDPGSVLSVLNRNGGGQTGDELFNLIEQALEWNAITLGYFDITASSSHGRQSTSVRLERKRRHVRLGKGTTLDFGGYAKGYALDRCVDIVKASPVHDALLNFGNSSVAALGNHPCGIGWKIGIDLPRKGRHGMTETTLPPGSFLSISGNHPRTGAHIVNPHTGVMATGESVISVRSPSGASGEALSTALFAAPPSDRERISALPECLCMTEIPNEG